MFRYLVLMIRNVPNKVQDFVVIPIARYQEMQNERIWKRGKQYHLYTDVDKKTEQYNEIK